MSVEDTVKQVEQKVTQFFALEREHIQAFLDYLSKRPLGEVLDLVRRLETAKAVNLTDAAPAVSEPAPEAQQAVPADAGVTTSS